MTMNDMTTNYLGREEIVIVLGGNVFNHAQTPYTALVHTHLVRRTAENNLADASETSVVAVFLSEIGIGGLHCSSSQGSSR